MFQNVGVKGYKEGLGNTLKLDEHLKHPHRNFKTIHIAGTNGKGSCSHTIASILQQAGFKTGLYTSPHLLDFRERIRINGRPISEEYVVDFVERERDFFEPLHPSFFELTTAMAFKFFSDNNVDIAVIEVGLGGRLDCTNIITPILSIITNISYDHTQFLGNTLAQIAHEKAGVIKTDIPVVIGESISETKDIFLAEAEKVKSNIVFAEDTQEIIRSTSDYTTGGRKYQTNTYGIITGDLGGLYQEKNTNTILHAIPFLRKAGYNISTQDIKKGFSSVCETTGLSGRWQKINNKPRTICDTGHNEGGFRYISEQLKNQRDQLPSGGQLHIVFGMVNDKDVSTVLSLLPTDAKYYFTKASTKRALDEKELAVKALSYNLKGKCFSTVGEAYEAACSMANAIDFIFIGGSTYIVADLFSFLGKQTR